MRFQQWHRNGTGSLKNWAAQFFGILTLTALVTSPTTATESYRAPDGSLFERRFITVFNLRDKDVTLSNFNRIIICSDRPDYFIPRIRRFVEFALSDKNYEIVDGREAPRDIDLNQVTLTYLGQVSDYPIENACAKKFPGFHEHVEKDRKRFLSTEVPKKLMRIGSGIVPVGMPSCGGGTYKFSSGSENSKSKKITAQASFSAGPPDSCLQTNLLNLFFFKHDQCDPAERCIALWKYVN